MAQNVNRSCGRPLSALWGLAVVLALGNPYLHGQWESPSIGGLNPVLPKVPLTPPRPAQGHQNGQQWTPGGTTGDRQPVAGFVDSLQGTDSAIELVIGQGRILTLKQPIESETGVAMIALGNPAVADFTVMPNPRMIRLRGISPGVTDISITTADGESYAFEIHVVYDLNLLHAQLRQVFPDAMLKVSQIQEHLVVEGQARSTQQVGQIIHTLQAYLISVLPPEQKSTSEEPEGAYEGAVPQSDYGAGGEEDQQNGRLPAGLAAERRTGETETKDTLAPQIINLLTVPGVQQVMLQVKIAELDRTALREIGADMFYRGSGGSFGTQISNATATLFGLAPSQGTTAFAIFPNAQFDIMLRALRRNSIISIMAEPNLVAMNGQEASFLAGGEFPVPVPQASGGGGISNSITIEFKEFGTQLNFVPTILDDETIRLKVSPEVSTIDEAIGVEISGFQVPGLQSRRLSTVVELKQGETLALAGLLQTEMN
ncbi:MAG: type II and III secretion system protein family protein, partial [Pirellulaceae bacterium]